MTRLMPSRLLGIGIVVVAGCSLNSEGLSPDTRSGPVDAFSSNDHPDGRRDAASGSDNAAPLMPGADAASESTAGEVSPSDASSERETNAATPPDALTPPDSPTPPDTASPSDAAAPADASRSPDAQPTDLGRDQPSGTSTTRYEIRTPVTSLPADGHTLVPLLIRGVKADGTLADDDVVLSLTRQRAGVVKPRLFKLGGKDPQSYFVPCSSADAVDCVGTTRVRMELASAPGVLVAESDELTVAVLDAVGSPGMCMLGGNQVFLDGGYLLAGTVSIREGVFDASKSARSSLALAVASSDPLHEAPWTFDFSMGGSDLVRRVYRNAVRTPFPVAGTPGLEIFGGQRRCDGGGSASAFEVHEISFAGNQILEFLVTFETRCDLSTTLRGCVHFIAPP